MKKQSTDDDSTSTVASRDLETAVVNPTMGKGRRVVGRLSAPQLASNKTDDGKLNVGLPSIKSVREIEEPEGDVDEKTSTEDKGLSDSTLGDLSASSKSTHPYRIFQ